MSASTPDAAAPSSSSWDGGTAIGLRRDERYMPELEAARGLAIGLVLLYHAMAMVLVVRNRPAHVPIEDSLRLIFTLDVSPLTAFVYAGHTGVSLFFVLSAFLLSRPFWQALSGGRAVASREFFRRRALRIMPAYAVAVVVGVAATSHSLSDGLRVIPYLTFASSIPGVVEPILPYSGVWWSLATEVQFYLVLPFAFALARTRTGRVVVVSSLVVYAAAYLAASFRAEAVTDSMLDEVVIRHSLLGRAPIFLAGIAAAWVDLRLARRADRSGYPSGRGSVLLSGRAAPWAGSLAIVGCLGLMGWLLQWVVARGYYDMELRVHAWHVVEGVLWAVFVLLLRRASGPLRTLLSSRPLQRLGVVSYSLYLIHFSLIYGLITLPAVEAFLRQRSGVWPALLFAAVAATASIALSVVTYALIERPFLRRKGSEAIASAAASAP